MRGWMNLALHSPYLPTSLSQLIRTPLTFSIALKIMPLLTSPPQLYPLIGQELALELLTRAIALVRLPSAYLFAGPEGVGRSSAARYFTSLLFGAHISDSKSSLITHRLATGNHPDLLVVQPTYVHEGELLTKKQAIERGLERKTAPLIRIEQVRAITEFLSRPPLEATRQVVIVEQAETMNEAAANALLKTLEEPGEHGIFILIAQGIESLLPTIVSRCSLIPFYRLSPSDLKKVLLALGHEEILAHSELLMMAQGSPGKAIAFFEQLRCIPDALLQALTRLPLSLRPALQLARVIDSTLSVETQLWLCGYLQHYYWQKTRNFHLLQQLDKTHQYLTSHCQPRLVWEVTLSRAGVENW